MDQIGDLQSGLGWIAPGPGGILTFLIRLFFVVAALAALFQLLAGAFLVIVSGGEKEKWNKAFSRMGHAILGVMSVSRSVGTLVKRGFVEEVSSEVYRATLKGKEYAEAYSDIRGGGTRKTVQA
jgi:hypothetical protein